MSISYDTLRIFIAPGIAIAKVDGGAKRGSDAIRQAAGTASTAGDQSLPLVSWIQESHGSIPIGECFGSASMRRVVVPLVSHSAQRRLPLLQLTVRLEDADDQSAATLYAHRMRRDQQLVGNLSLRTVLEDEMEDLRFSRRE